MDTFCGFLRYLGNCFYFPGRGSQPVDYIQKSIGGFGRYQFWLCVLIFASKVPIAWHQMAIIFLAPKASYVCDGEVNKCPCDEPEFDTSIFQYTIVMKWKLICEKRTFVHYAQVLFQGGVLIGSILFGMASDRWGRRWPFIFATVFQTLIGLITAYVDSFLVFNILRFTIGLTVGGTMVIGFVSIMEFCGTEQRPPISAWYHLPFNIGHLSLAALGYYFRNYADFQLAISAPIGILLCYFCLLPESPRWLLAMKRTEEAIKLCEHVAKINKRPTASIRGDIYRNQAELERYHLKKGTLFDLFKTPNLRKNILCMAFNWFSCSYCFYGISQYVSFLTGNIFVNVAISAAFSTCGTIVSVPLLNVMRRKTMLLVFQAVCAICLYLIVVLPDGIATIGCACVGNLAAFIVFIIVYLHCSELFPTVVRNAAIGFSSGSARFGSMIAPLVIQLGDTSPMLPPLVFAIPPTIGFLVSFLLPETKNCPLMTTLAEGEQFGKKPSTVSKT